MTLGGRRVRALVIAGVLALAWALLVPRTPALVALSEEPEELEAPPEGPPPEAVLRVRPKPPPRPVDDPILDEDRLAQLPVLSAECVRPVLPAPRPPGLDAMLEQLREQIRTASELAESQRKKETDWPIFTDDELGLRNAMRRGWRDFWRAKRLHGPAALAAFDRARRDMSEGLLLPEMADPALRAPLEEAIAFANAQIYGSTTPFPGVTEVIRVVRGDYPRHVVRLRPFGPNAILYWTLDGRLDPRKLPAGAPIAVPLEPLWLFVDRSWHALFVFLGDSFVKEYRVAVGKTSTPTPAGTFAVSTVLDLAEIRRRGRPERWLHRLGSAWIRVRPVLEDMGRRWGDGGTSIHGTDDPDSIGTDASDGSIRLSNADALEVLGWVNSEHGPERRVIIR